MNKLKGFVKIIVAWVLIKMTIGGLVGGGIGTHNAIEQLGVSNGSLVGIGFSWGVIAVVTLGLIVIIKKLISSGINNFRS